VLVAILGAGPIGAAVAQALTERARFRAIRFIDESAQVAAGKALDLRQATPVSKVDVDLTATDDLLAAAGAAVIVVTDPLTGAAHEGEAGLATLQRSCAGAHAAFVFAGPNRTG
jgi:malate/lactate dehydrogenase